MSKHYKTFRKRIEHIKNKDGVDCILIIKGKETTPLLTKIKRFFKRPKHQFIMVDTKILEEAIHRPIKYGVENRLI